MKRLALLWILIAAAGCGKVGPPQPPIVRTPKRVEDLKVAQNGHNVVLTWTNPSLYVDNNPASDLKEVRILQNGVPVKTEPMKGAGQRQTTEIPVSSSLESDLTFAVVIGTERGRSSNPSESVPIRPVEVPGTPRALTAKFDQLRIILDWQAPERNAGLVGAYLVARSDRGTSIPVMGTHFEDSEYELDMAYTYTVTAARGEGGQTPGLSGASVTVTAKDTTGPAKPSGLTFEPQDMGLLLEWMPNKERDLKEYQVYRSDRPAEPICRGQAEVCQDPGYQAGQSYRLVAVDRSDNSSEPLGPVTPP